MPVASPQDEVCNAVCNETVEELKLAIARLTRLIGTAKDDQIPDLVTERRDMRAKLDERRRAQAGNVVELATRRK